MEPDDSDFLQTIIQAGGIVAVLVLICFGVGYLLGFSFWGFAF